MLVKLCKQGLVTCPGFVLPLPKDSWDGLQYLPEPYVQERQI